MINKTLIGKNNVLFLINDACKELEAHCNNLNLVKDNTLSRYQFKNYLLFVYPNKSFIYKHCLPDEYVVKYRPAFQIYNNKLKTNIYDLYEILKNEEDVYYKTDTHINNKGNYIVYNYFIKILNQRLGLNVIPKKIHLNVIHCELSTLQCGIGDLTWSDNLGNQTLSDKKDNYYFNDDIKFYCFYKIINENNIRFLNYNLKDNTKQLEGQIVNWDIVSKNIIYIKNNNAIPLKVIIFYDSFLLAILSLYFDLFNELYLIKNIYDNEIINKIMPDFIFEFRVERFLF